MSSTATRRRTTNRPGSRSGPPRQRSHTENNVRVYPLSSDDSVDTSDAISLQPTIKLPGSRRNSDWSATIRRLVRAGVAIVGALLLCVMVSRLGIGTAINDEMGALGFDPERARFIRFTLMTLICAFVVGLVLRWRIAAWIAALLYYIAGYLIPYASEAQHPAPSVDGTPQLLIPGAFALNIVALLAIAVISGGIGAVLGEAAGETLFKPAAIIGGFVRDWLKSRHSAQPADARSLFAALPSFTVTVLLIVSFALAAANVATILNFGTTATIYQPAQMASEHGVTRLDGYVSSALGGRVRQFLIYLPPSYSSSPTQRYPVIYLLHGVPGSMSNWFAGAHTDVIANDLFSNGKAREAIFVLPDGNGPVYQVSEWANSLDGRQRMEDSIVEDLIPYVDRHYRTIAEPAMRAIGGISDGGFAAVNIALHHPELFGKVISLGGFYTVEDGSVFGRTSTVYNDAMRRYNSPGEYVTTPAGLAAARMLTFYIGAAVRDRNYYHTDLRFYEQLGGLGIHAILVKVDGTHSWRTWGIEFAKALPLIEPPLATNAKRNTR